MSEDRPTSPGPADPELIEIRRGDVHWRFDVDFLTSNWTCLYGRGCKGILAEPAEELRQGCCSLGAHFGDGPAGQEESRTISAYSALLDPDRWQFHAEGTTDHDPEGTGVMVAGIYGDADRTHTRVVDGACVFLNRPGFAGGEGCALHLAALDADESPIEWKPSVCWQLPLHVDWALLDPEDPDGPETATVRRWTRADWGDHGRTMAWVCTEPDDGGEAYCGDRPVIDSLADELIGIAGDDVVEAVRVELRRR